MVEHSVNINEEEVPHAVSDYMQALESAKLDEIVVGGGSNVRSGEVDLVNQNDICTDGN